MDASCPGHNSFTNSRMRFSASLRFSRLVAYEQRMCPSPDAPKAVPGTQATCFSSSRRVQNVSLVRPVPRMDGNT